MPHGFEILTELPYSGKTDVLIATYVEQLQRNHHKMDLGSCLWLTPTFRSRRAILDQIAEANDDVIFAPNVFTFDQFADAILNAQQDSATFLNPIQKRILVRAIIQDLHRENRLQHFAQIHQTSGFLDLVVGFLSEIKRDEIWPDDLEKSFQQRNVGPKERELHLIYQIYQDRLRDLDSFDAEGRFWLARTHILDGKLSPFEGLRFVVVDGFSDFTRTQHEILDLLAERLERVVISLPYEAGERRQMLFAKSGRTIKRFERNASLQHHTTESLMGSLSNEYRGRAILGKNDLPGALRTIASHLFTTQSQMTPDPNADGLEVISISGLQSEHEIVAERIKQLLVGGVPASEIAIVYRSLTDIATPLSNVLREAGIPYSCEKQDALTSWPIVKFLRLVLKVEQEDWSFDSISRLLHSNHFGPPWPDLTLGVSALLAHLRSRNIQGGRKAILGSLERRAEFLSSSSNADSSEKATAFAGFELAQRLDDLTESIRTTATFHEWLERLRAILDVCCHSTSHNSEDQSAHSGQSDTQIDRLFEILFNAVQFIDKAHQEASRSTLSLSEFNEYVSDLVASFSATITSDEQGVVRVLSASQVRNMDIPYLFLAGMNEGNFPSSKTDSCLFNEADRQWLNEAGVTLPTAEVHLQDEMLLFYNVVTRAKKRLTISYCSTSPKGQPLYPSPFVTAVRTLFQPDSISESTVERWTPIATEDTTITPSRLRTSALSQAFEGSPGLLKWLLSQSRTTDVTKNLLAASHANAQRFEQTGMTAFEGILSHTAPASLRKHFDKKYQFSATQLENYATCPFRFLISNVLKVEPLKTPATSTDYAHRGMVVHEAFSKLHSETAGSDKDDEPTDESLTEKLKALILEISSRSHSASPLEKTLRQLETELMVQWAELYSHQWDAYLEKADSLENNFLPTFVEVPFGNVQLESDDVHRNQYPPLKVGSDENHVFVQGRIDRIDVGTREGTTVYNVIDYKTGSAKTFQQDDVERGLSLQLALYMVAVIRLELLGGDAVPYQMGYWAVKEKGFFTGISNRSKKLKALGDEIVQEIESTLDTLVPRLADRIRSGTFPVFNRDNKCTGYCAYSTVCRVNQIRSLPDYLNKEFDVSAPLTENAGQQ